MTFTTDGKVTREPQDKAGAERRGHLEALQGRLLHHLEGQRGELLHAGQCRQEQVVGREGRDDGRGVEQVAERHPGACAEPRWSRTGIDRSHSIRRARDRSRIVGFSPDSGLAGSHA